MSNRGDSKEDLFQRLLELEYGLLDEPEAHELRQRIESEEAVARLHAEVQRTRGLLSEAAVVNAPEIVLQPPRSSSYVRSTRSHRKHRYGWSTFLALAAALLVSLGVGGEWWFKEAAHRVANESIVINLAGPSTTMAGGMTPVEIQTQNLRDEPIAARVDVALIDRLGRSVAQKQVATDRTGQATVFLPTSGESGAPYKLVASRPATPSVTTSIRPEYAPRVTRLSTDRPIYRPGERLYFRALTLERESFKPVEKGTIQFDLRDPNGNIAPDGSLSLPIVQGVAAGSFNLSANLMDGNYRLTANSPAQEFVEQSRFVEIRAFREPRLRKRLELDAPTVAAGSTLKGELIVENDDGQPLSDAPVHVQAELDNMVIQNHDVTLDKEGKTQLSFSVPGLVRQGPLNVDISVGRGVNAEQLNRQIPLTQGPLDLEFFPESGPLVVGLKTQVYFQAFDVNSKPVAVRGRVVDDRGTEVARFEAENQGRGRFEMQPEVRRSYRVELTQPEGATSVRSFPNSVTDQEVILHGGKGVFEGNEPLDLAIISSAQNIPFIVSAYCRQVPVGFVLGRTIKGKLPIRLNVLDGTDGVVRITVFDRRATPIKPVAERLVYRRPVNKLSLSVEPDTSSTSPQSITVRAGDEKGAPAASATLGVSIVDQRILELSQEKSSGIDAHFLLLSEIRRPQDIEDADFLLRDDSASASALDLVLGTHGWRQFRPAMMQNVIAATTHDELPSNPAIVQEPVFSDNVSAVQETVKQQLAALRVDQQWYRITTIVGLAILAVSFLVIRSRSLRILAGVAGLVVLGLLVWQLTGTTQELSNVSNQVAASPEAPPTDSSSEAVRSLSSEPNEQKSLAEPASPLAQPQAVPPPAPAEEATSPSETVIGNFALTPSRNDAEKLPSQIDNEIIPPGEASKDAMMAKKAAPLTITKEMDQKTADEMDKVELVENDLLQRPGTIEPAPTKPAMTGGTGGGLGGVPMAGAGMGERAGAAAGGMAGSPAPVTRYAERSRSFAVAKEEERRPAPPAQMWFGVERSYSPSFRPNLAWGFVQNPTAYWNPLLSTDDQGNASISFDPSPGKPTYVISIEGHTAEGRLGSIRTEWKRPDDVSPPAKKAER